MSPILFSLFINDIEQPLQTNLLDGISLDQITIFLLLFADDAVIMSDTKRGLQIHWINQRHIQGGEPTTPLGANHG